MEYLTILYWIGYAICFLVLLLFGGWALANEDKVDGEIDILNLILSLCILPFFSWILILVCLSYLIFNRLKD